jgi:hypothetical protein
MRILLQDIHSRNYYQRRGQWTSNRGDAFDFQFSGGTPECLEELELVGAELVVESDPSQPEIQFLT